MNNSLFEINYTKYVQPKYGSLRDPLEDDILTNDNESEISDPIASQNSINYDERIDMTIHDVYSIDPEGCEDADDAFSIFYENDKLFLAIHIADPTDYIKLGSNLWNNMVKRTTTKYPSNRKPIHLIPDKILKISSLKGDNDLKKSITILSEIDKITYIPIGEIKLLFTKILVKKTNAYSYKIASENKNMNVFRIGLEISKALLNIRSTKTKGVKLNELSISNNKFINDKVYLYQDSEDEKLMKQMIAEFAIYANSYVGEYLKKNLNIGIFRSCDAKDWLINTDNNITGEEMIQQIISNGITADYTSSIKSHDLVGMPEYCHFTSPIRRVADCVCHYLLKYIFRNKLYQTESLIPFNDTELENLSLKCLETTKKDKKNQYLDIKFRLLQVMDNMIYENGSIILEYYINSYIGSFLNIVVCKINNFRVHMTYTLRVKNFNLMNELNVHKIITCTKVNCFTKFDQNCIPELDNCFI